VAVDEREIQREVDAAAHKLRKERKRTFGIGLLKGLAVTLRHLFKHNVVIEYPDEKQDLPARTRGVIALKEENCTVCMLCARECPDWCIYIDSHKETLPPKRAGGRPRKRNVLDRFAIDYALCMYCGICVDVCPYDALFWSREFEYAEYDIRELTHEKEKLSDWMATVLPPPPLEEGALLPGQPEPPAPPAADTGAAEMKPATAARPATQTSSAAEARPAQAADAPKAPSAVPEPPSSEHEQAPAPAATSATQVEEAQPSSKAETEAPAEGSPAATEPEAQTEAVAEAGASPSATARGEAAGEPQATEAAEPEPLPNVETPPAPAAPAPVPTEDPEKVYRQVLEDQLAAGSSPQVAEARAKVARLKAERGVRRAPTPVETEKRVPSAPVKGHFTEPVAGGAPAAEGPEPEPGPVAPTQEEEEKGPDA